MKMKSLILLVMAIGCGFVAMLGVQQVLSGDKKPRVETGKVLTAVTNIMPGQPLDDTNVAFKDWPKGEIPEGAVTTREQFAERSLRVAAVPSEVIMAAKLNEKGVFGGSSEIPTGMRVATVPVNITKTHSGLIMPGDRVDVVVTYNMTTPGRGSIQKAKTILQYIEVFATDNIRQSGVPNAESKEMNAKNISLIVTPDQYNLLMLAESKGKLSLALRHRGDDAEVHPADVDETMFDGIRITRGQDNEKEDEKGDEGASSKEKDKKHGKGSKVASKEKEKEVEATEKPTWTLKIFEGDKLREEQVEVPQEASEAAKNPEKPAKSWPAFLKNFFHRAS